MKSSLTLLVVGLLLLAGCTHTAQLITLRGNNVTPTAKGLIFENDSLTISYSFYSDGGLMTLALYNKLNVPLYIDWKNSAFIVGTQTFDYWHDVADVKLNPAYGYYYRGYGRLSGTIAKDDQVGFIPPQTRLEKRRFVILPAGHLHVSGQPATEKEPKIGMAGNPKKTVDVASYTFNEADSPCRFRNFLTLSTQRDFQKEFHLDTRFYAATVRVMPATKISEYRNPYLTQDDTRTHSSHRAPDSFYLIMKARDRTR